MVISHSAMTKYGFAALAACAGAATIFWKGRETYRHFLFGQPPTTTFDLVVISLSVLAIQIAYWAVLCRPFPFASKKRPILATVLFFFSRISFMLAGALFSIVVFVRLEELEIKPVGAVLFVAVLFTLFCFCRWIEALGYALEAGRPSGGPELVHDEGGSITAR